MMSQGEAGANAAPKNDRHADNTWDDATTVFASRIRVEENLFLDRRDTPGKLRRYVERSFFLVSF